MLDGKRALVIGGGGGGIDARSAGRLAAAGSAVAVADIDRGRAEEAAGEVEAAGVRSVALVSDVSVRGRRRGPRDEVAEELGGLDVLVTVVGGQLAIRPRRARHGDGRRRLGPCMFDLNLRYVAEAVRAALRVFLAQGTGGTIVQHRLDRRLAGSPGQAAYGAAKAGLANLARSVAVEYGRDGIRMNVVACGADRERLSPPRPGGHQRSTGSRSDARARPTRSPTRRSSWPRRCRRTSAAEPRGGRRSQPQPGRFPPSR
jgi:3-oxoacyl-[acyl-carrier protein] reductase